TGRDARISLGEDLERTIGKLALVTDGCGLSPTEDGSALHLRGIGASHEAREGLVSSSPHVDAHGGVRVPGIVLHVARPLEVPAGTKVREGEDLGLEPLALVVAHLEADLRPPGR